MRSSGAEQRLANHTDIVKGMENLPPNITPPGWMRKSIKTMTDDRAYMESERKI